MGSGSILLGLALLPVRQVRSALSDLPYNDSQLQILAGYYTSNGKYLGGIPEIDREYELFRCTEFNYYYSDNDAAPAITAPSSDNTTARMTTHDDTTASSSVGANVLNATTCVIWMADEINSDEYSRDTCSCWALNPTSYYCEVWTCSRIEIDHAILLQKEVQSTRCTCTAENDLGNFCAAWECLTTRLHGGRQYEEFRCMRASSDAVYCEAWTGEVQSSEEVRVSSCACVDKFEGVSVCAYWNCEQRGLDMCSEGGLGWCNLGISLGVGGFFGSWGALLAAWAIFRLLHRARHPSYMRMYGCFVLLGFFWMTAWSIGVVVWGGVDGAIYAGIWWGGLILIDLLYACCTNCS